MDRREKKLILKGLLIVLCVTAGSFALPLFLHDGANWQEDQRIRPKGRMEDQIAELTISCVGDVMVHQPQIPAQYDPTSGTYSFHNNFQYVKEYIEEADLALCNVETTLRGQPYTGFPNFSSPEALAEALSESGFDVAITANNHMMDTGLRGLARTLEVLRGQGLVTVGSQMAPVEEGLADGQFSGAAREEEYALVEAAGVKIGIVAYTYASGEEGAILVNGSRIAREAEPLINYFRYTHLAEDMEKVRRNIQDARSEGAELVIVYYHWGEEYQRSPNDWQLTIARQTAEMGADVIFASHPHVLQGVELLEVEDHKRGGEDGVRQVPVFYSMGNFISNQRTETLENRYTEQGMIASVHLEYNKTRGMVTSLSVEVVPTWVDRRRTGGTYTYTIVPLTGDFENNQQLQQSGTVGRAKQALDDVKKLLGEEYVR